MIVWPLFGEKIAESENALLQWKKFHVGKAAPIFFFLFFFIFFAELAQWPEMEV